jgi:membrane protein YdbS with pleckstrin-like domain
MEQVWTNPEIPTDSLPRVEEVSFQKHPVRYKAYRNFVASLVWILPVIGVGLLYLADMGAWYFLPAGLLLLLIAFSFVAILKGYKRRSYALRERDLTYKKGWLFYSTTTVPFNRIQHTEVSQGPLERRYELCTLKIYTAGGSASDLSIPGLEQEEAQELRDFIARKAAAYA